jgi:hypothetical protein
MKEERYRNKRNKMRPLDIKRVGETEYNQHTCAVVPIYPLRVFCVNVIIDIEGRMREREHKEEVQKFKNDGQKEPMKK